MDDDSDLDKDLDVSLGGDPHIGLDSSIEEGGFDRETTPTHELMMASSDVDTELPRDQVSLLHAMVREMQQSFQEAFQKLATISEREDTATTQQQQQPDNAVQQRQQEQLDQLTRAVHEIKGQLTSLTQTVQEMKKKEVTGGPRSGQGEVSQSQTGTNQSSQPIPEQDHSTPRDDGPAPPEEWNSRVSELPPFLDMTVQSGDNPFQTPADSAVTAVACRSLSLTQALGEKCLQLQLTDSSDDETHANDKGGGGDGGGGGAHENGDKSRRVSHYTPKSSQSESNRRHTMPANVANQARQRDLDRAAQRQRAVKELADSERDYCSRLWSLLNTYLTPLQTSGFLSPQELNVLFPPYLDQLYAEHCHICTSLQDRLVHWTHTGVVADLLARVTDAHNEEPVLSLYRDYAEDLPTAVTCLKRALTHSPDLKAFLKAIQQSSCESEDLMSLILTPVQHLPKFLLQVQQVAGPTPPTHPDYPLLQSTLKQLQSFMECLNEDLAHTMNTLSGDSLQGSSADSSQVVSARDSGVHSTEEDGSTSRGHTANSHWSENFNDSLHNQRPLHRRLARLNPGGLSALSQPDLTTFANYGGTSNSDPRLLTHMPRSQSALPAGGEVEGSHRAHRKFKVKKRHGSPSPVNYPEIYGHINSPKARPSSAIDFLSHTKHNYPNTGYSEAHLASSGSRPLYPGPAPRPHSALGPVMVEGHRPTIISRKYIRRSQPPMPVTSNDLMLTSLHSVGHLRSPQELLPSRHSPYHSPRGHSGPVHVLVDVDDDDDEDDTRASDSRSFGTSNSHYNSSSHASFDSHDLELDFYQSQAEVRGQGRRSEFSSREVENSLAHKLYSLQGGLGNEDPTVVLRRAQKIKQGNNYGTTVGDKPAKSGKDFVEPSPSKIAEIISDSVSGESFSESKHSENKTRRSLSTDNLRSPPESSDDFPDSCTSDHESVITVKDPDVVISANVKNQNKFSNDTNESQLNQSDVSSGDSIKKGLNSHPGEVGRKSNSASPSVDECATESNRQFLLSLTGKNAPVTTSSVSSHSTQSSTTYLELKASPRSGLSTGAGESVSDPVRVGSQQRGGPSAPPRPNCSSTGQMVGVAINGHPPSSSSQTSPNKLSQPLPYPSSSNPDQSSRISPDRISQTQQKTIDPASQREVKRSSLPNPPYKSQNLPTSKIIGRDRNRPLSVSQDILSSDKLHPFSNNMTNGVRASSNGLPMETVIDQNTNGELGEVTLGNSGKEENSQAESSPLSMSDLSSVPEGIEVVGKRSGKKKGKESGKSHSSSDIVTKASEDPVAARKKMHLKSSLRNLFTKKRGRVILADVEREVVMEMAAAATSAVLNKSSTSTPSTPSKASSTSSSPSSSSKKKKKQKSRQSGRGSTDRNLVNMSIFEIKTRKDQGCSTSSPMKACKQLHSSQSQGTSTNNSLNSSAGSSNKSATLTSDTSKARPQSSHSSHGFKFFSLPRKKCSEFFEIKHEEKPNTSADPVKPESSTMTNGSNSHTPWWAEYAVTRSQFDTNSQVTTTAKPSGSSQVNPVSKTGSRLSDPSPRPSQQSSNTAPLNMSDTRVMDHDQYVTLAEGMKPHSQKQSREKSEEKGKGSGKMSEGKKKNSESRKSRDKYGSDPNSKWIHCHKCGQCYRKISEHTAVINNGQDWTGKTDRKKNKEKSHVCQNESGQTNNKKSERVHSLSSTTNSDLSGNNGHSRSAELQYRYEKEKKKKSCLETSIENQSSNERDEKNGCTAKTDQQKNKYKPISVTENLRAPIAHEDFSVTDCLKPCAEAILLYEKNRKDNIMTRSCPPGMDNTKLYNMEDQEKTEVEKSNTSDQAITVLDISPKTNRSTFRISSGIATSKDRETVSTLPQFVITSDPRTGVPQMSEQNRHIPSPENDIAGKNSINDLDTIKENSLSKLHMTANIRDSSKMLSNLKADGHETSVKGQGNHECLNSLSKDTDTLKAPVKNGLLSLSTHNVKNQYQSQLSHLSPQIHSNLENKTFSPETAHMNLTPDLSLSPEMTSTPKVSPQITSGDIITPDITSMGNSGLVLPKEDKAYFHHKYRLYFDDSPKDFCSLDSKADSSEERPSLSLSDPVTSDLSTCSSDHKKSLVEDRSPRASSTFCHMMPIPCPASSKVTESSNIELCRMAHTANTRHSMSNTSQDMPQGHSMPHCTIDATHLRLATHLEPPTSTTTPTAKSGKLNTEQAESSSVSWRIVSANTSSGLLNFSSDVTPGACSLNSTTRQEERRVSGSDLNFLTQQQRRTLAGRMVHSLNEEASLKPSDLKNAPFLDYTPQGRSDQERSTEQSNGASGTLLLQPRIVNPSNHSNVQHQTSSAEDRNGQGFSVLQVEALSSQSLNCKNGESNSKCVTEKSKRHSYTSGKRNSSSSDFAVIDIPSRSSVERHSRGSQSENTTSQLCAASLNRPALRNGFLIHPAFLARPSSKSDRKSLPPQLESNYHHRNQSPSGIFSILPYNQYVISNIKPYFDEGEESSNVETTSNATADSPITASWHGHFDDSSRIHIGYLSPVKQDLGTGESRPSRSHKTTSCNGHFDHVTSTEARGKGTPNHLRMGSTLMSSRHRLEQDGHSRVKTVHSLWRHSADSPHHFSNHNAMLMRLGTAHRSSPTSSSSDKSGLGQKNILVDDERSTPDSMMRASLEAAQVARKSRSRHRNHDITAHAQLTNGSSDSIPGTFRQRSHARSSYDHSSEARANSPPQVETLRRASLQAGPDLLPTNYATERDKQADSPRAAPNGTKKSLFYKLTQAPRAFFSRDSKHDSSKQS